MRVGGRAIPFSDVNKSRNREKLVKGQVKNHAKYQKRWCVYDIQTKSSYYLVNEDDENESTSNNERNVLSLTKPNQSLIERILIRPSNRCIRIFVSSTFRDMVDEREQLNKIIFPQLNTICKQQKIFFSYVDLRWGITQEEADEGKSISLCLDSIDQCRPYFLCCIGERYGWYQKEEGEKDELLARTFDNAAEYHPWVNDYRDRSITELEILYSSLFYPDLAKRSLFFFKKSKSKKTIGSGEGASKLSNLKQRIIDSGHPIKYYSTLKEFEQQVVNVFGSKIKEDVESWNRRESTFSNSPKYKLLESSLHHYYARTEAASYLSSSKKVYLPKLDQFCTTKKGHKGVWYGMLLVTGKRGGGKGALISSWYLNLFKEKKNDTLVISHFVGASSNSVLYSNLLRRVIQSILIKCDKTMTIPDTNDQLIATFKVCLKIASKQMKKVIIIIDGLDKLNPAENALTLSWLPITYPRNVFVVVSATTSSSVANILQLRSCKNLKIQPLTREQQREAINIYLSEISKKLTSEQIKLILGPKTIKYARCSNPLFLSLVLEELRVCGRFDDLDKQLKHYCTVKTLIQLYDLIIERWEKEHGTDIVKTVLSLLAVSRKGLSDEELQQLIGKKIALQDWNHFRVTIDSGLVVRQGLLYLKNIDIKEAIKLRYLRQQQSEKRIHSMLADYFESVAQAGSHEKKSGMNASSWDMGSSLQGTNQESDTIDLSWRYLRELPWHLQSNGSPESKERLKTLLTDERRALELFKIMYTPDRKFDLMQSWRFVTDDSLMAATVYQKLLKDKISNSSREERGQVSELLEKCCLFSEETGCFDIASTLWRQKLKLDTSIYGSDSLILTSSMLALASILEEKDSKEVVGEAVRYARRAFNIRKRNLGENNIKTVKALQMLALLNKKSGNYKDATQQYKKVIATFRKTFGELADYNPVFAKALNEFGDVNRKQANYSDAAKMYQQAANINKAVYGHEHPIYAINIRNLGIIYKKTGEYKKAETLYKQCLKIFINVYGVNHYKAASVINHMADVNRKMGNLNKSESNYRRALRINTSLYGPNSIAVIEGHGDLALVNKKRGKYTEAEKTLIKCLDMVEQSLGEEHYKYAHFLNQLADVKRKMSNYTEAMKLYERALRLTKNALGNNHIEVAEVLANIAVIHKKFARYDKAEQCVSHALDITEKALGSEHPKVADLLNKLADVYRKRSKYFLCAPEYLRSISIYEKTMGNDHVDLADPLTGLAITYKKTGKYNQAEPLLKRVQRIIRLSFGNQHPKMANCMQNLADIYRKTKRVREAENLYTQALNINKKTLGSEDIEVAECLRCLSIIHIGKRRALREINQALSITEDAFTKKHAKYAGFLNDKGNVDLSLNSYGAATKTFLEALELNTELWGKRNPEVAHSLWGIGIGLFKGKAASLRIVQAGRKGKERVGLKRVTWQEEAENYLKESVALTESTLGALHPHMASRLNDLGDLYEEIGLKAKAKMTKERAKSCK